MDNKKWVVYSYRPDYDKQSFYCAEGGCGDNQAMVLEAWSHQPQGTTRAGEARGVGKLQANIFAFL